MEAHTTYAVGLIHEEDGVLVISFPDFPGLVSSGRTLDEVMLEGELALAAHVDGMIEDGADMPALRNLGQLRQDMQGKLEGTIAALVPLRAPRT